MSQDYELINNKQERQYEFRIDGLIPRIEYITNQDGNVYLTHTEIPSELSGKGVIRELIRKVLTDIQDKRKYVVPFCPVVASYIQKYPQWKSLITQA